jgi:hypothetical protein
MTSEVSTTVTNKPFQRSITLAFVGLMFVSLLVFALLALYSARQDMQQHFDVLLKQTETNIIKATQLADTGFEVLEISLDERMKRGFEPFLEAYEQAGGDPDKIDLVALQKDLGEGMDLYIINSDGIISHTTYTTDLGHDMKKWTEFYTGLQKIREKGGYAGDRITTETRTGQLRKFAYYATPDKKYILELGLKASEFKSALEKLDQIAIAQQLQSFNPFLKQVRIFDRKAVLLGRPDVKPDAALAKIVDQVFVSGNSYQEQQDHHITRFIKADFQKPNQDYDSSLVIELVYDLQPNIDRMQKKQMVAFGVLGVLLLFIVLATMQLTRTLSAPVAVLLAKLGNINSQLEQQIAHKSFLADLAQQLQSADSAAACGNKVLSQLHAYCQVSQGMLALVVGHEELRVVSRFCAQPAENTSDHYTFGQGVLGQCAKDRHPITLHLPRDPLWQVQSGLGESRPAQVMLLPVEHGGVLTGVLEVGWLQPPDATALQLINEVLPILAVSLHGFAYRGHAKNHTAHLTEVA